MVGWTVAADERCYRESTGSAERPGLVPSPKSLYASRRLGTYLAAFSSVDIIASSHFTNHNPRLSLVSNSALTLTG